MQKQPVFSPNGDNRPLLNGKHRDRGMVVYVDIQLRSSKRFDAAGIETEHPHLFQPIARRRNDSTTSVNSLSPIGSPSDPAKQSKDEGQLRYWTAEMCSNSPDLFDFVVTVRHLSSIQATRADLGGARWGWYGAVHLMALVRLSQICVVIR